jgi:hypothetical protein
MGQVVPGDGVAVGLALNQFRPAEGPPATDLVVDVHVLAEDLLQGLFLESGGNVRLSAGIETDVIGDPLGGKPSRTGHADPDHGQRDKHGEQTDGRPSHGSSCRERVDALRAVSS